MLEKWQVFSCLLLSIIWIFGVLFLKAEMLAEDVKVFLKLIMLSLQEKCQLLAPTYDLQLFLYKLIIKWGTCRQQM